MAHAYLAEVAIDQFRLADWERTLALEEPRIPASPVSRLDAFFDPGLVARFATVEQLAG